MVWFIVRKLAECGAHSDPDTWVGRKMMNSSELGLRSKIPPPNPGIATQRKDEETKQALAKTFIVVRQLE